MKGAATPTKWTAGDAQLSPCGTWRYTLTRSWEKSSYTPCRIPRPLVVLGLNPSTADASKDDPTIRRCISYAQDWGYSGLVMLNLFAYRSTDPKALYGLAPEQAVGPENDRALVAICIGQTVLAAWGKHGRLRKRDQAVMQLLRGCGQDASSYVNLVCLGENKDGTPVHPLYQPSSAMIAVPYPAPRFKSPSRAVIKTTPSPQNATRWLLSLGCGHETWTTSRGRPARKLQLCQECPKEPLCSISDA